MILVTASVWDQVQDNDYLAFSCGCSAATMGTSPSLLWDEHELEKIPDDEKYDQALSSAWCKIHGEEFCNKVLDGYKSRPDVDQAKKSERNKLGNGTPQMIELKKQRQQKRGALQTQLAEARRHEAGLR